MAISPLPPAPAPTDTQQEFDSKAFALVEALNTFIVEANDTADQVNEDASAAATKAGEATDSAALAEGHALDAAASAGEAAATAGAAAWVSGNSYAYPATVFSPLTFQTYRKRTANSVTTIDPSADSTHWEPISSRGIPSLSRSARTSNTQLGPGDKAKLIDVTSGTFTQTFAACATLGDGWWCFIRNGGAGDVTLDPNGSETIDGLASFVMYPGEVRLVQCDGSALRSFVLNAFYRVFAASGTFVKPPGYSAFGCIVWSAGASGGKGSGSAGAVGGGAGGCISAVLRSSQLLSSETVTVGAGGAAVTTASTNGNAGGDSSFGPVLVIGAGRGNHAAGGAVAQNGVRLTLSGSSGGGVDGYSTGGVNGNFAANAVWGGGSSRNAAGNYEGGSSIWGGGSGGCCGTGVGNGSSGGASMFGGAGGAGSESSNGEDGQIPAGGGGATRVGTQSGAGARGEVRVWGIV